ncbi:MAG TPA: hypothetical protein VM674_07155, partial [Candidatus Acidoferrum sp.]|nr:hypothetical protein [Candidatus Acidoferrum sp.]
MSADERLLIIERRRQRRNRRSVGDIPEGDTGVAEQSRAPRPPDGAAAEADPEGVVIERKQ